MISPLAASARLMVVDDEVQVSALLARHLAKLGYRVVRTATSPDGALAAAAADQLDLVLMDIELNGAASGVEVAGRIREEYGLPVIFVSGNLTAEVLAGQELPAFAHVPKPIDRDQLGIAVNTALTLGHHARWNRAQAAVAIAAATESDLDGVLARCADALVRFLGVTVARISILDRDGAILVVSGNAGLSTRGEPAAAAWISDDLVAELMHGRETVFTNALGAGRWATPLSAAVAAGMQAFVSHPLIVEGSVVGAVVLIARHPLPEATAAKLAPLTDVIAVGIQRKQLELEARAQSDQLGLMHSALSTVVSTNDWRLATRLLLLGVIARTRARCGVFAVVDETGLSALASEGFDGTADAALKELYEPVIARGEIVRIAGWLVVPLRSEGRVIGLIGLANAEGGFHPADQVRLEALAQLAGVLCQAYLKAQALARANAALQQANQDLEERVAERTRELTSSNQELERFAYVSSHDLQEPLRVVTSYVQLLARRYADRLDEDAQRFIRHAVTGVARMQTLINDLLTFSRVGSRPRTVQPTSMTAVLARVLDALQSTLVESQAVVTTDELPVVMGDEEQLVQLVQNLVANAIKFRGEARPAVHVTAVRAGDDHEIQVRDNGIGIEPQYFDRIFVMFQRLHGPAKYPGTGIGLAICKKIAERHGGRIWVTSQLGRGTVFHFTVRACESREATGA